MNIMRTCWYFWAVLTAVAAGGAEPATNRNDASAALFDRQRLLQVRLELDPADWDKLRQEHHDLLATLGTNRFDKPESNPYHIYRARVTIDGERVADVGLRKRGFIGSASMTRPSLGIRFDAYDAKRRFAGLSRMALNNNLQDPSQVHQVMAYAIFAAAGVPAPRCSLALVSVNGQELGVYSHVEAVEEEFLQRQFGSAAGNLYEGQISDFRPQWVKTFERKNHKQSPGRGDLEAVVKALQADQSSWLGKLRKEVDVDEYLSFWAVESLINHWDSYSAGGNNFFIYRHPEDHRFRFIPWGADAVLGERDPFSPGPAPESVKAGMLLSWRLYADEGMRERYRQRLREVLRSAWHEDELLAELDRLQKLVRPHLQVPPGQFVAGIARTRSFIRGRRAVLEKELEGLAPEWPHEVRAGNCLQKTGVFRTLFTTTWQENLELTKTSPVNMTLEFNRGGAQKINFGRVASMRAKDQRNYDWPVLGFLGGQLGDGRMVLVFLAVQPERFQPGMRTAVDGYTVGGVLLQGGLGGPQQGLLGFLIGTLTFDKAGTEPGETVSGKVDAEIYQFNGK
jgi:hypothetical protein